MKRANEQFNGAIFRYSGSQYSGIWSLSASVVKKSTWFFVRRGL